MCNLVLVQGMVGSESPHTDVTRPRFLSSMNSDVSNNLMLFLENFATEQTAVHCTGVIPLFS